MKRPSCEVADVVRTHREQFAAQYGKLLDPDHWRVLHAIENCRTAILGGNRSACDRCGHRVHSYNSCRNRHCPKCQGAARQKWLANRSAELLPVPYFHVVFTLPHLLGPLALQNKRVLYGILFRAVSETLLEVAADPKHLGADIGFLTVLHTWGQNAPGKSAEPGLSGQVSGLPAQGISTRQAATPWCSRRPGYQSWFQPTVQ
jgi:Transposase zinc-binding domain